MWSCSGSKTKDCLIFLTTSRLRLRSTRSGPIALFTNERPELRPLAPPFERIVERKAFAAGIAHLDAEPNHLFVQAFCREA
jgi:hypothetical protein